MGRSKTWERISKSFIEGKEYLSESYYENLKVNSQLLPLIVIQLLFLKSLYDIFIYFIIFYKFNNIELSLSWQRSLLPSSYNKTLLSKYIIIFIDLYIKSYFLFSSKSIKIFSINFDGSYPTNSICFTNLSFSFV
jgi:hypothetical protein